MNEAILSLPTPVKTLSVTQTPCRELCNFLVYCQNPEILNERARRHLVRVFDKIPASVKEVGELFGAEKCEKNRKLYFDCTKTENHRGILIHNFNAQFWVHFFRCGIGLVNVSCFSQLASAECSVLPLMTRTVADSFEYQWFIHDLNARHFTKGKFCTNHKKLANYFIKQINPTLIIPYSIYQEKNETNEQYKFVQGSLDNLKQVLKYALFVFERIKREKYPKEKHWVSPYLTVTCGNLKDVPCLEPSTEFFLNQIGQLAVRENVPYTVLNECNYRRVENNSLDWVRKNKYRFYFNFQEELQNTPPREKLAARFYLIDWLKRQGREGEWIIKTWKLESDKAEYFNNHKSASDNQKSIIPLDKVF